MQSTAPCWSSPPGLTVISAENTRGKSTLVQAIIFALGLEKMLSPRREVPLPRVMTVELQETVGGPDIPVLASQVLLEVENGKGDVITLQRSAKGPLQSAIGIRVSWTATHGSHG